MKFLADAMLGKLTRWLRLAGQDVVYIGNLEIPPKKQDDTLIEMAEKDKRTLLTSDIALHRKAKRSGIESVLVQGTDVASQLVHVSKQSGKDIKIDIRNSRCPVCNGTPKPVKKESVRNETPAAAFERHEEFWKCNNCGKIYWDGAHWKTIIKMAEKYEKMME